MARILVVEDDDDIREAYVTQLARDGYSVSAVATAEEALEVLDRREVDLLIVDLWLPGMDGAELCRTIRAHERQHAFPILMITSMRERMGITLTQADARWAPVDCCIDKAAVAGELGAITADLLARHAAPDVDSGAQPERATERRRT